MCDIVRYLYEFFHACGWDAGALDVRDRFRGVMLGDGGGQLRSSDLFQQRTDAIASIAHVGREDREQRAGVCQQQALAAGEPQPVPVSVLEVWRRSGLRRYRRPDDGEELSGAPQDHHRVAGP